MVSVKRVISLCGLCVAMSLAALFPVLVSFGQVQGRCEYCVFVPCDGNLAGVCQAGGVSTKCSLSGSGCDTGCSTSLFCNRAAPNSASASCTAPDHVSAKLVRSLAAQAEGDRKTLEDAQMREELIRAGGSTVQIQTQLKGPVTIVSARHTGTDMLAESQVVNLSDKIVAAIRMGWVAKSPNEPDDVKMGDWTTFPQGFEPEQVVSLAAQKIDTAPLWKVGTIVRVYVARIRFQDGSTWEYTQDKKLEQNNVASLFPPTFSKTINAK